MNGLPWKMLLRCFLRTYWVGAAYNARGLQNIGFMYALEPGLEAIHRQGKALRSARLRYARHYNCHPFLTPMLLGAFLNIECAIAEGRLAPQALLNLKDTTANTLSAIGDSFFTGTLLNTWVLVASSFILLGFPYVALALTGLAFALLQCFKLAIFVMGCKRGLGSLLFMRRLDLINWSERLKYINAALLAGFLWIALPGVGGLAWGGVGAYLLTVGWLVSKIHLSRVVIGLVLLTIIVIMKNYVYF